SRYTGLLVFAGIANAGALACLIDSTKIRRPVALGLTAGLVVGSGLLARQWLVLSHAADAAFRDFRSDTVTQENRVVEYLRAEDPRVLTTVEFPAIPYPVSADLMQWLHDPGIRATLPASARRAIFRHDHPGTTESIAA